jgi:hypothetical protein
MTRIAKTLTIAMLSQGALSACVPQGRDIVYQLDESAGPRGTLPGNTSRPGSRDPVYAPLDRPLDIAFDTVAAPEMAFDHLEVPLNQFALLSRIQHEGPPEVAARLHGCQKMQYSTIGNVLRSFGVQLPAQPRQGTTGALYTFGSQALGAPNFLARSPEGTEVTTAGATKLFDIFVAAAPAVIEAMPGLQRCQVAGQPTAMFDAAGRCTLNGIACLQGSQATEAQQAICDAAVSRGSTPEIGRTIAVAAILAAANTCE